MACVFSEIYVVLTMKFMYIFFLYNIDNENLQKRIKGLVILYLVILYSIFYIWYIFHYPQLKKYITPNLKI